MPDCVSNRCATAHAFPHQRADTGSAAGRLPLLKHEKALIIQSTIFDERAYNAGIRDAMKVLIDEWGLRYPGVKVVEHVYFYAVHGAD